MLLFVRWAPLCSFLFQRTPRCSRTSYAAPTRRRSGPRKAAGPLVGLRSLQYGHLAEDVPGQAGLVRLRWLGDWFWYAPGIFHTASRDLAGTPTRLLLSQCRDRAEAAGIAFADPAAGYALGTTSAAMSAFAGVCRRGWFVHDPEPGGPGRTILISR